MGIASGMHFNAALMFYCRLSIQPSMPDSVRSACVWCVQFCIQLVVHTLPAASICHHVRAMFIAVPSHEALGNARSCNAIGAVRADRAALDEGHERTHAAAAAGTHIKPNMLSMPIHYECIANSSSLGSQRPTGGTASPNNDPSPEIDVSIIYSICERASGVQRASENTVHGKLFIQNRM